MSTLIQKSSRSGHHSTNTWSWHYNIIHLQAISNILAGHSKASNLQPKVSKVGDISQDKKLFTELEKALEKEEMDDEAFVDKFGYVIEYSCNST